RSVLEGRGAGGGGGRHGHRPFSAPQVSTWRRVVRLNPAAMAGSASWWSLAVRVAGSVPSGMIHTVRGSRWWVVVNSWTRWTSHGLRHTNLNAAWPVSR